MGPRNERLAFWHLYLRWELRVGSCWLSCHVALPSVRSLKNPGPSTRSHHPSKPLSRILHEAGGDRRIMATLTMSSPCLSDGPRHPSLPTVREGEAVGSPNSIHLVTQSSPYGGERNHKWKSRAHASMNLESKIFMGELVSW